MNKAEFLETFEGKLAGFCGFGIEEYDTELWIHTPDNGSFTADWWQPHERWDQWMGAVEPKIMEKHYWGEYIAELISLARSDEQIVLSPKQAGRTFALVSDVMQVGLDKRVEALRRVLE